MKHGSGQTERDVWHGFLEEVERQLGIKEGESTSNLEYSLETVACVGCCALSPVVTINDEVYGRLRLKDVAKILPTKEIA